MGCLCIEYNGIEFTAGFMGNKLQVIGDSGTGKSYLVSYFDTLQLMDENDLRDIIKFDSPVSAYRSISQTTEDPANIVQKHDKHTLIFIDDAEILCYPGSRLEKAILSSPENYYILFGRGPILPDDSIGDLCYLRCDESKRHFWLESWRPS